MDTISASQEPDDECAFLEANEPLPPHDPKDLGDTPVLMATICASMAEANIVVIGN
jgi:hypothetical protein